MLIITATTFIVQVIGPICVKYGVTKAGEVGLNITADDIMKKSKVQDVVVNNHKICSKDSYTIVKDTEFIKNIIDSFSVHENSNYCVKNSEGKLCGQISLEHLKETIHIGELADSLLAMDIMDKPIVCCTPESSIFAFSAASFNLCIACLSFLKSMPSAFLNSSHSQFIIFSSRKLGKKIIANLFESLLEFFEIYMSDVRLS